MSYDTRAKFCPPDTPIDRPLGRAELLTLDQYLGQFGPLKAAFRRGRYEVSLNAAHCPHGIPITHIGGAGQSLLAVCADIRSLIEQRALRRPEAA